DAARGGTGIRTRRDGLRDEAAVAQLQRAIGARRELQVVRDDDERDAELARQRLDQCIDLGRRLAVEIPGGFVGEHAARLRDQRTRERDALTLAARELARPMLAARAEP